MSNTLTIIPSRYEVMRLRALLLSLTDTDVIVLDNGHEQDIAARWGLVETIDTRGMSIYGMWNLGWEIALDRGYPSLALINDDIRIHDGTISVLASCLDRDPKIGVVYPDWPTKLTSPLPLQPRLVDTIGTVSTDGMTGFAFVMRTALPVPAFDEAYHWWYGDDVFERSVRGAGYRVCRAVGVPCEHESDSEAGDWYRRPELKALVELDRARWESS